MQDKHAITTERNVNAKKSNNHPIFNWSAKQITDKSQNKNHHHNQRLTS